jgi:pilus assembly protein Flp/PilA
MSAFTKPLVHFLKREDGPTAVEYAVTMGLIVVTCITAISMLSVLGLQTFLQVSQAVNTTA